MKSLYRRVIRTASCLFSTCMFQMQMRLRSGRFWTLHATDSRTTSCWVATFSNLSRAANTGGTPARWRWWTRLRLAEKRLTESEKHAQMPPSRTWRAIMKRDYIESLRPIYPHSTGLSTFQTCLIWAAMVVSGCLIGSYGSQRFAGGIKGKLFYTHGEWATMHHAAKHINAYGVSVRYGHTHKPQVFTRGYGDGRVCIAIGTGCLRTLSPSWAGPNNGWLHGFGWDEFWPDGRFTAKNIVMVDRSFCWDGKAYGPVNKSINPKP